MIIVADTSALFAAFDADQEEQCDFRVIEPLTPGFRSFRILPADK